MLGNIFQWLQSLGIGLIGAVYSYVSTATPASGDAVESLVTGLVLAGLARLLGGIVNKLPKA